MADTNVPGQMTGKPLIESDRVEGTTVYEIRQGAPVGDCGLSLLRCTSPCPRFCWTHCRLGRDMATLP